MMCQPYYGDWTPHFDSTDEKTRTTERTLKNYFYYKFNLFFYL